jgi:hypothetical protein
MITLQLTPVQYDIVKAAVSAYSDGLMKVIDSAQEPLFFQEPEEPEIPALNVPKGFSLSEQQVRAMKDAGAWDDLPKRVNVIKGYISEHRKNVRAERAAAKKAAPYGLKKDGTPRKAPGRKKVAA